MIVAFLFNLIVLVIGAIFSLLPQITTLPTINGFDIDGALVQGMGEVHTFFITFWPLGIMFQGFLFLMGWYALRMGVRFLIGHRAPGTH